AACSSIVPPPAKTPQNRQRKLKSKKVKIPFIPLNKHDLPKGQNAIAGQQWDLFEDISGNPLFAVLPLTFDIAAEVAALGPALRDPADRAIVATARVHRLKVLTSDRRVIASRLAPVVD
ncbi:MAG: PIN domain-containing protein, partial [Bryobacterales bacterium]|nr:PIN domain-containing protein [Bryobacterales bacterium]